MNCLDSGPLTELDYAARLRRREGTECCGPLVNLEFVGPARELVTDALEHDPPMGHRFWMGCVEDTAESAAFTHCVTHWFDLIYAIYLGGKWHHLPSRMLMAARLFRKVCTAAGWDHRELANRLTPYRSS